MASLHRPRYCHSACSTLRVLLPSFVASAIWPEQHHHHQHKLHPTSYLDGLRGIASFLVFFCHYTEKRHGYLLPTYGLGQEGCSGGGGDSASTVLQLPYIRVLYAGRPMVHIFFVISGFVLAYKPLRLLHGGRGPGGMDGAAPNLQRCYTALASSAFRRPIRLFFPCAVSTLGIAILAQTGQLYAADDTWAGQLRSWAGVYTGNIAWPWAWDRDLRPGYDIHLWTIPVEFVHAMLLFLTLVALSRLRTCLRQAANVLLAVYSMGCGKWAAFEFLAGLFLAELQVVRSLSASSSSSSSSSPFHHFNRRLSRTVRSRLRTVCHTLKVALHSAILLICLFVAGWPNEDAGKTPGIRVLLASTPASFLANGDGSEEGLPLAQKFWFAIAAVFLVWSCGELDAVRRLFEGPVPQYCGRISYSIYLVHGPALDYVQDMVLGRPATPAQGTLFTEEYVPGRAGMGVKGLIGIETPAQRVMTWLVGLLVIGPIIVWIADLFWRFIDAPIVALGRTVELACVRPDDESPRLSGGSKERVRDGYAVLVG